MVVLFLNFFEEGPVCFLTRDRTPYDGGVDNTKDQIPKELIHHRKGIGAFSVDQILESLRKKKKVKKRKSFEVKPTPIIDLQDEFRK